MRKVGVLARGRVAHEPPRRDPVSRTEDDLRVLAVRVGGEAG